MKMQQTRTTSSKGMQLQTKNYYLKPVIINLQCPLVIYCAFFYYQKSHHANLKHETFNRICLSRAFAVLKGTHIVYFSSSLYIINQKPMIPRTHFHCITTWLSWIKFGSAFAYFAVSVY